MAESLTLEITATKLGIICPEELARRSGKQALSAVCQRCAKRRLSADVENDTEASLRRRNMDWSKEDLSVRARKNAAQARPAEYPTRVVVLGDLYQTDFRKDTPGGMMASEQYFDVSPQARQMRKPLPQH